MDFATFIASRQAAVDALTAQRAAHRAEQDSILAGVDGRAALTDTEQARFDELQAAKRDLDGQITAATAALDQLRADADADADATRAAQQAVPAAPRRAYDQVARVGRDQRVYTPDSDKRGQLFLRDVAARFFGDASAAQRLDRHMAEERVERGDQLQRATTTANFSGLVIPQYLTDLYAPAVAAMRPFADVCNRHDLPDEGMSVVISKVTTASSVALQTTQNTAVSETNLDDTELTIPVQTAAGQQTVSRQAIDRGSGVEDVALDDLFRRYATTLDSTLINQATTGLSAVATATTYTDTNPTGPELYPKILGATAASETAFLAAATVDYAVMHSRRWLWLSSQMTSTWPMINTVGIPPSVIGTDNANGYNRGVRGALPSGLGVVVDNNIPTTNGTGTNEDEIYVVASSECHLWEDSNAPMYIRADQPAAASLGVLLVVYGYFAYTFNRYVGAQSKVSGTGLTAPTF